MTICQSCGAEKSDQDRFCRNCGVAVAGSVGDLVDTRRFNPDASVATAQRGSRELTNPLYVAPAAAYPAQQESASPYQTASLRKRLFRRKALWLTLLWLVSLVAVFGIGIGAREMKLRRNSRTNMDIPQYVYHDDAQNALGFQPGSLRDAGYSTDVKGLFVESLTADDSPAAVAGIQAGDVMTELNGQMVRNNGELSQALGRLKPQTEVPVKVYREDGVVALRIKIADRLFPPLKPEVERREQGDLGVHNLARRCCVPGPQRWGVEIQGVHENGPADLAELRRGDVITEFNGVAVRTAGELYRRIRATKPRSKVTVTFYRGNVQQKIEMILGYRT